MESTFVEITNDMLAQAIKVRYGNANVDNTLEMLLASSQTGEIWKSVCRDILKNVLPVITRGTVAAYVDRCFLTLQNNKNAIKDILLSTEVSTQSDSHNPHSSTNRVKEESSKEDEPAGAEGSSAPPEDDEILGLFDNVTIEDESDKVSSAGKTRANADRRAKIRSTKKGSKRLNTVGSSSSGCRSNLEPNAGDVQNDDVDPGLRTPADVTGSVEAARQLLFSRTAGYPQHFQGTRISIRSFVLDPNARASLLPGECLLDPVLNAFAAMSVETAREQRNASVMYVDTLYTAELLEGTFTDGFKCFLAHYPMSEFKLWILPLHMKGKSDDKDHWTLMIVDTTKHILVLLDSFREEKGKSKVFNSILDLIHLIDPHMMEQPWTFHYPEDIPKQGDGCSCGVHAIIWMHIICNCLPIHFNHEDTLFARAGICRMLTTTSVPENAEHLPRDEVYRRRLNALQSRGKRASKKKRLQLESTPPDGFATTLEYCSRLLS